MKSKSDKSKIIFLIVLIILISLIPVILNLTQEKPLLIKELNYDFTIQKEVSFILDKDMLHFGGAPPNSVLQRNITITSTFPAKVELYFKGEGNLIANQNIFFIDKDEIKSLEFELTVPEKDFQEYNGTVYFHFYELK